MKIIFLATSKIGVETFYSISEKHDIKAVLTQPDSSRGRSKQLLSSPIAEAAKAKNIPLYKSDNIGDDLVAILKKYNADLFISFSYGVILKKNFFDITKNGGINIHPSLLPKLRGPSPIRSAILNGFTKSGITIQKMKLKIDSGDIIYQHPFDINEDDDAVTIEEKISSLSAEIINPVLAKIENNEITPIPQNDKEATYTKLLKKEDGLIDWDSDAKNIINKIRAFINWPVAFSYIDNNRINIYKAKINNNLSFSDYKNIENGKVLFADKANGIVVKTNDSLINIETLQQKGKKILECKNFINGCRDLAGKVFSQE